jgi:hypothetical protein
MWMRCAVFLALGGVGCSCEAKRTAPPPPLEADRVVVPGAGAPVQSPGAAIPAKRTPNPPLLAEEGRLTIEPPPATPAGVEATAHLRLTANRGYEINEQFHYKLTLEPTPGVTLPKTVFTRAGHDAERLDGHELAIAMKLTVDKPGDYTVHGKLDFAVCKIDSQCLPKTMPVAVQLAAR